MASNWGRIGLGFVGGALSGYDLMLKTKMKEEYEAKREEAQLMRQKNLAQYNADLQLSVASNPNNPAYQATMQNIEASKANMEHQKFSEELDKQKFNAEQGWKGAEYSLAAKRLALAEQEAGRSREDSDLNRQIKEEQLKRIKDPVAVDLEANQKIADYRYKQVLANGGTEEQALVEKALVEKTGVTELKDLRTIGMKAPEEVKAFREFVGKAVTEASKSVSELDDTTVIQEFNKISNVQATNPAQARAGLVQLKANEAASVYSQMTDSSITKNNKTTPTTNIQAPNSLKEVNLSTDQLKKIASGVSSGDSEFIALYNQLKKDNPEYFNRVNNFVNQLENRRSKEEEKTNTKLNLFQTF